MKNMFIALESNYNESTKDVAVATRFYTTGDNEAKDDTFVEAKTAAPIASHAILTAEAMLLTRLIENADKDACIVVTGASDLLSFIVMHSGETEAVDSFKNDLLSNGEITTLFAVNRLMKALAAHSAITMGKKCFMNILQSTVSDEIIDSFYDADLYDMALILAGKMF